MSIVKLADFRNSNGDIDWSAYDKAQTLNGDRCLKCHSYTGYGKGHADICWVCQELNEKDDEVEHQKFVRCPKCRHAQEPYPDYGGPSEEAIVNEEDIIDCSNCSNNFRIGIRREIYYQSPELLEAEKDGDK